MLLKLDIGRNNVEAIIKAIEQALSNKMISLKQSSQACYVDQRNLNLGKLALNLAEIQAMKEYMTLFEEKIEQRLADILDDY